MCLITDEENNFERLTIETMTVGPAKCNERQSFPVTSQWAHYIEWIGIGCHMDKVIYIK